MNQIILYSEAAYKLECHGSTQRLTVQWVLTDGVDEAAWKVMKRATACFSCSCRILSLSRASIWEGSTPNWRYAECSSTLSLSLFSLGFSLHC